MRKEPAGGPGAGAATRTARVPRCGTLGRQHGANVGAPPGNLLACLVKASALAGLPRCRDGLLPSRPAGAQRWLALCGPCSAPSVPTSQPRRHAPALTAACHQLADAAAGDAAHEPEHPAWGACREKETVGMSAWHGDDGRRADRQGPWAGLRWGTLLSTACRSHVSAAALASPTQGLDRGLVAVPAHICKRHGVLSPCTGRA